MVVLCDREAVFELLNRKGANYNDRPPDRQFKVALNDKIFIQMHEDLSLTNLDSVLQIWGELEFQLEVLMMLSHLQIKSISRGCQL